MPTPGDLRPFEQLHAQYGMNVFSSAAPGVNATAQLNVHSIAIQVPISQLVSGGKHGPADQGSVIGVWTSASRQRVTLWDADRSRNVFSGPFHQVSRLANPLFNEVLIPLGLKDLWNTLPPSDDKRFADRVAHPELAALLPALYPGVFPNLAALVKSGKARADLQAILLTGIPSGVVTGFQNYTGPVLADMVRLNTAIPPSTNPNQLGVVGGDLAGFPNGRRVFDDVVTIELRAIAGVTVPLVDKTFTPDAAASKVTDGLTASSVPSGYLDWFPYLGTAYSGFAVHGGWRWSSGPEFALGRRGLGPDPVDGATMGDRQHPGRRAAPGRIEPGRGAPDLEQDLLGDLLRLRWVAEHLAYQPVHGAGHLVIHRLERAGVTARHVREQRVQIRLAPLRGTGSRPEGAHVTNLHGLHSAPPRARIGRQ
jgi:hypothetical protein